MSDFNTLLFVCAICRREIRDYPWRKGRDQHIEPVCRGCEREWTERTGKPDGGTLMDRRKAAHVLALANCLHNKASVKDWEAIYAR